VVYIVTSGPAMIKEKNGLNYMSHKNYSLQNKLGIVLHGDVIFMRPAEYIVLYVCIALRFFAFLSSQKINIRPSLWYSLKKNYLTCFSNKFQCFCPHINLKHLPPTSLPKFKII
jgi:hypothetical protein